MATRDAEDLKELLVDGGFIFHLQVFPGYQELW